MSKNYELISRKPHSPLPLAIEDMTALCGLKVDGISKG